MPMDSSTELLSADALCEEAMIETGLTDWGPLAFRESLERLVTSLRTEARQNPVGIANTNAHLLNSLRVRLQLQSVHSNNPALGNMEVAAPIIIVGLPRTGSTNLYSLLAQDPAYRVPRYWEVAAPFPAVREADYWTDPRIDAVQAAMAASGILDEEIQAAAPFRATTPAECGAWIDHAFMSQYRQAAARTPSWSLWRDHEADWTPAYGFHKQFLQHLQTNYRAERWLLKSPEHLIPAETLAQAYPDALFVHTHRDPALVLGSVASVYAAIRRIESDHVDPIETGREQLDMLSFGVDRMMAARDKWAGTRKVVDIYLKDLARSPMDTVETLYDQLGLVLSDEARQRMVSFISGAEGAHEHKHNYRSNYKLENFGLNADEVHERFADYMVKYDIAKGS